MYRQTALREQDWVIAEARSIISQTLEIASLPMVTLGVTRVEALDFYSQLFS
jgi:hypothetical protein